MAWADVEMPKGEARHGTIPSSAVPWQAGGVTAIGGGFFFA
jgi:hypothetical protein